MKLKYHRPASLCLAASLLWTTAAISAPAASAPATRPAPSALLSAQSTVVVRRFRFEGNTVFSDAQLAGVLRKYTGRALTLDDLEEARRAVTALYVETGYVNSGAVLPNQTVADGTVLIRVVEGKLSEVRIQGTRRLHDDYLRSRIELASGTPLNLAGMKDGLELLRDIPNLKRINAELRPGVAPGQSLLDVQVEETPPFHAALRVANDRTPSVGAEEAEFLASCTDLTGNGDPLSLRYGITKGGFDRPQYAQDDDYSIDYALPVTPADTTVEINVDRSDDLIIEAPFTALDITSETNNYALTIRQPMFRNPGAELGLSAAIALGDNRTTLLGQPFSFSPGANNGRSRVTVVRLVQDFSTHDPWQALAMRSTFSFGLDAFDSTIHRDGLPDSSFIAWLGQVQYIRRLNDSNARAIFRTSVQLTRDPLLSLEQFSIGGMDTVRGYRQNQLVTDNGIASTLELRLPLIRQADADLLTVAPFVDAGYGWNVTGQPAPQFLPSAGVGLLWNPNPQLEADLYYGYAFKRYHFQDTNLQDMGIQFNIEWKLF